MPNCISVHNTGVSEREKTTTNSPYSKIKKTHLSTFSGQKDWPTELNVFLAMYHELTVH